MLLAWSEAPWRSRGVLSGLAADLLICTAAPSGVLWQQQVAALARRLSMVVAVGGPPAGGVSVLSAISLDVTAAQAIAFATPADHRRRGACLVEIAPRGRVHQDRVTVVATDLSEDELDRHRAELAARIPALGLSDRHVIVASAGRRLVDGLGAGRRLEPVVTRGALLFTV